MDTPETIDPPSPDGGTELSDADLATVAAGKEGTFARKVLWAMYSSSGFTPGSNEPWRTAG
jgi:hypothetical protein